jgi:hypothetical protein
LSRYGPNLNPDGRPGPMKAEPSRCLCCPSRTTSFDDADRGEPHPDIFQAMRALCSTLNGAWAVVDGGTPPDAEPALKADVRLEWLVCRSWPETNCKRAFSRLDCAGQTATPVRAIAFRLARGRQAKLAPTRAGLAKSGAHRKGWFMAMRSCKSRRQLVPRAARPVHRNLP